MNLTLVEQLARYELGGNAEQSAEDSAGTAQTAGELGVVGGIGVFYAGVDDGANACTDAGAQYRSNDYRSGSVTTADELDVGSAERDRAIDPGLSPVTDQFVVVG